MNFGMFNVDPGLEKVLGEIDRIIATRHAIISESWPAKIGGEHGILGYSSGIGADSWNPFAWYKVWFDTKSGSKVLHNKLSKTEAQRKYTDLKAKYGFKEK
ncbi:MAG: hypothetical protein AAF433_04615 [Bacteroidota bacterium]